MPEARISIDDPRAGDVRALVERHLKVASSHKPAEDTMPRMSHHCQRSAELSTLPPSHGRSSRPCTRTL